MNAPRRLFVTIRLAGLLAGAGAGALLSGCAERVFRQGEIDPTSPVRDEIAATARANTDFPSFDEVPARPADVRPAGAYGAAADRLAAERDRLERETAPASWSLSGQDTAAFAAAAGRAVGPAGPVVANDPEAYAAELRRRATPPPPPKR